MRHSLKTLLLLLLAPSLAVSAQADVSEKLPGKINPSDTWVFYAHGSAVYLKNKTIGWKKKTGAFSGAGHRVITTERYDIDEETEYAENVARQIGVLLKAGTPAKNIFVGGYSRGAVIALDVANRVKNPEISFFLIAGCKQDSVVDNNISGRFLSLYAGDDEKEYGSCAEILEGKNGVSLSEKEYAGKGHKYFSGMNSDWFHPIRDWMAQAG